MYSESIIVWNVIYCVSILKPLQKQQIRLLVWLCNYYSIYSISDGVYKRKGTSGVGTSPGSIKVNKNAFAPGASAVGRFKASDWAIISRPAFQVYHNMVDVRCVRLHMFDVLDARHPPCTSDIDQNIGNAICCVTGPGLPGLSISLLPSQSDIIVFWNTGCVWEGRGDVLVNV